MHEWRETKQQKIEALSTYKAQLKDKGLLLPLFTSRRAWRSSPLIISLWTALVLGRFALSWLRVIVVDLWNASLNLQCLHHASFSFLFPKDFRLHQRASRGRLCVHLPLVWLTGCHGAVCKMLWFSAGQNTSPARVSSLTSFGPMFIKPAPSCCLMFYAIYLLQQCCAPIVKNVWLSKVKKCSATFQRGWVGWLIQWRRITACSNDGMVLSEWLSGCSS